ncbi:MAG: hypothetical protein GY738_21625, partial [Pseudoalteromonas sp.]|nr:hypothetical protein [Pseudoalteromonas sp.]
QDKDDVVGGSINGNHNIGGISVTEDGRNDDGGVGCRQGETDDGGHAGATVDPLTDGGVRVSLNGTFEGVMSEARVASDGEMVNETDGEMEGDRKQRQVERHEMVTWREIALLNPAFAVDARSDGAQTSCVSIETLPDTLRGKKETLPDSLHGETLPETLDRFEMLPESLTRQETLPDSLHGETLPETLDRYETLPESLKGIEMLPDSLSQDGTLPETPHTLNETLPATLEKISGLTVPSTVLPTEISNVGGEENFERTTDGRQKSCLSTEVRNASSHDV